MASDPSSPEEPLELPPGTRVAAVVSTFHRDLCEAMLDSAQAELLRMGLCADDLVVVRVPGAFELPLVARRLALRDDVDCVLALGLILKGETPHDVYIAQAAAQGILSAGLAAEKPVLFGVLTCDTLEQARARALPAERGGSHDKGREVARAAAATLAALRQADEAGRAAETLGFGRARGEGTP